MITTNETEKNFWLDNNLVSNILYEKNIDVNDKCLMPSQELVEQTILVCRKSGVRTILLPNMLMIVIESGVYLMQFLPLTAKETQVQVFATGSLP